MDPFTTAAVLKYAPYLLPFLKPVAKNILGLKEGWVKDLAEQGIDLVGEKLGDKIKEYLKLKPDAATGLIDEHFVRYTGKVLGSLVEGYAKDQALPKHRARLQHLAKLTPEGWNEFINSNDLKMPALREDAFQARLAVALDPNAPEAGIKPAGFVEFFRWLAVKKEISIPPESGVTHALVKWITKNLDAQLLTDLCKDTPEGNAAFKESMLRFQQSLHDMADWTATAVAVLNLKTDAIAAQQMREAEGNAAWRDRHDEATSDLRAKLDQLLALNAAERENFSRLVGAFVRLPEVLAQIPSVNGQRDDPARYAAAYSRLEREESLPPGTLEKKLPGFSTWLLRRPDLDPLLAVQAHFVQRQYDEAETQALAAERVYAQQEIEQRQHRIKMLELAARAASEEIQYTRALDHYSAAIALTSHERDFLQWLGLQNAISYLYYLQGRYLEGLAHSQQVWQTARQAGQDESPAVLLAHMRYASALLSLGQASAAELEYRAVIQVQERVLGPAHPDTLKSRNNLANALGAQGKCAEEVQQHREVLEIKKRVLGSEDPSALSSWNNLAVALDNQGRHAEAEQEHRAVLKVMKSVLDAEHPDTLRSRMNLANALYSQAKYAAAEPEYRAIIPVQARVLGAEHPDTLASRNNLALVLRSQGRHAKAEQEHRKILKIRETVLSAEHPEVARSCYNLALCLEDQKQLQEALAFMQRAEQVWTQALGLDHPDTKDAERIRERIEAAVKAGK